MSFLWARTGAIMHQLSMSRGWLPLFLAIACGIAPFAWAEPSGEIDLTELSLQELTDIERIEVIRGPAGTTWGTNTVNGIVNIICVATVFASQSKISVPAIPR